MTDNNKVIAEKVLQAVGGKENVTNATHCMTRLRLNLKDTSIPNKDEITAIPGVLAVVESGGQYQVVIGQNVAKVYPEFARLADVVTEKQIDENLDQPKEKLTLKKVGSNILNYLAGSMTPLIPAMMVAAMFRTIQVILGPDLLHLISDKSNAYVLLDALYNAFFYFMPIFIGWTAAKKLGASQVIGLYTGAMLVVPSLVALDGKPFDIYGFIPTTMHNYAQTVLPVILSVWVMFYIERFFKKIIPDVLSTIFVPFLTVAVLVPLSFGLLAPLGSILGDWIGNGLIIFHKYGGFIAIAVIGALWEFLVMSGMHQILIVFAITTMLQNGSEALVSTAGMSATWAAFGMALGAFLKLRDKDEKALSFGYFVSGIIGGVTEPVLYGVGLRYKRPFISLIIGGFLGALYGGLTGVRSYIMGATNFLSVLGYVGGGTTNIINGCISVAIAFFSTAILTYFIGFPIEKNER
ncbi:PTS transporter subunit EIIC [Streptococcus pluranimalium]|uniref:PTS fructose transporter subunit IIB n=1 Tax=Streptococcus pluranimalium TaxID=82348 RepID=A0A2L0D6X9_9STRE|nr:PTS transporter subunit EIIC [Streptococcus pluranimalium]AUW97349.1 PTS fructose transporter subunit IIB [Streptococcus pluranimalium]